jgi:hypothetical protein
MTVNIQIKIRLRDRGIKIKGIRKIIRIIPNLKKKS